MSLRHIQVNGPDYDLYELIVDGPLPVHHCMLTHHRLSGLHGWWCQRGHESDCAIWIGLDCTCLLSSSAPAGESTLLHHIDRVLKKPLT